jgi:hypothetical protein
MKDYNETAVAFVAGTETEKDDAGNDVTTNIIKSLPEERFNKLPDPKPETIKTQTFTFHEVESVDDAQVLFGPDLINVINRGGILKQQNVVRGLMRDEDFDPVEGAYDLAEACARLTERIAASPVEKAAKALSKLSPEDIAKLLASFAQVQAGAGATA